MECLPDASMKKIDKLKEYYSELVIEDLEKFNKIVKDLKGDNVMVNKAMQKYEADVTAKINELLEKKVNQKQAIEILVTNFPTLSKSMLTNSYKRLKSEWDKNNATEEIDPDVEEAMEKISEILDMGKDKESKKVLREADKIAKVAENDEVVVAYTIAEKSKETIVENKEEVKVKETALKVKSMVVEGENGTYKVCDAGIELTNEGMMLSFENEAALEKFVGEFKQVFAMMG
jgi:lipopolysaccharide export system protein LptA